MAHPLYSAGARYERAALRTYLARLIRSKRTFVEDEKCYQRVLAWVKKREVRYDKKRGGL